MKAKKENGLQGGLSAGSGPNLLYLRTPWVGGLPPMVKNLSTEKTQFLHLAAKYKKSNLKRISSIMTMYLYTIQDHAQWLENFPLAIWHK